MDERLRYRQFNSLKFDIPMLAEEFLRADVEFDFRK